MTTTDVKERSLCKIKFKAANKRVELELNLKLVKGRGLDCVVGKGWMGVLMYINK
jgi:hypothetical protein